MSALPRLFYSPDYDIHAFGLEKLHPFDTCKHSRAYGELQKEIGQAVEQQTTLVETIAGNELLLLAHSQSYLDELKSPAYLARALEVGFLATLPYGLIEARVLQPMRRATMGTVMAARHVLEHGGAAINFAGGYHHASADKGEGFCLFADIPIAINDARQSSLLKPEDRVLIVDLDAHQGNGFERVFSGDRRVVFLDAYNNAIYPQDHEARSRIDYNVPLAPGTDDDAYLAAVQAVLSRTLQETQPALVFYNAGTDIYEGDLLGGLKVSGAGVLKRDAFVFSALRQADVPWVMVPSGGYSPQSYHLIANAVKLLF